MSKESLRRAAEILNSVNQHEKDAAKQREQERNNMIFGVSQGITDSLKPILNQLASQARMTKRDMADLVSKVKVETHTPDVVMPEINVPTPRVTVNPPKINIPDVVMPDKMNIEGFVSLMGVDLGNPLPVQIRTANGAPVDFSGMGGGGGGAPRYVRINNGEDEPIPISGTISATFSADFGQGETASETLRTVAATDSVQSVNIVSGSASGTEYTEATNTELGNGGLIMARDAVGSIYGARIGSGTSETALRVNFATDSIASVAIQSGSLTSITNDVSIDDGGNSITVDSTNLDIRDLTDTSDSVRVYQVSGGNYSVEVTNTITETNSTAILADTAAIDTATNNIQTAVQIMDDWDATHDSAASADGAQIMAEARTSNPTAVGNGDAVRLRADVTGRGITRPIQARDLLATAYVSLANGTETTLLAASAGVYHDLVWVMGANQSDAAVTVDLRPVTAGNVAMSLEIPANSTAGIAPAVPYPMNDSGNNWTVDMGDITGTTVDITGLFSKEV